MLRAMYIGGNLSVTSFFEILLHSHFGLPMDAAFTASDAKRQFDPQSHQLLIINLDEGEVAPILDFIQSLGREIPILFTAGRNELNRIHQFIPYHALCSRISYGSGEKNVAAAVGRLIKTFVRRQKETEPWVPMRVSHLKSFTKAPQDLYVKLNERKFVKIFRKNDLLELNDLNRYSSKEVEFFYLKASDHLSLSSQIMKILLAKVSPKELKTKHLKIFAKYGHEAVAASVLNLGLTDEALEMADASISFMIKTARQQTHLSALLEQTLSQKGYMSEHSVLVSFVTTGICRELSLEWDLTSQKLVFASFFHDICTNDEELAKVADPRKMPNIWEDRMMSYLNHPHAAIELLSELRGLPPDVDRIIALHHEKPDGTGFPRQTTWQKIFPLAAIFIVAEDFVDSIFHVGLDTAVVDDVLVDMQARFDKGNFKVAFHALRRALGFHAPKIEGDELLLG